MRYASGGLSGWPGPFRRSSARMADAGDAVHGPGTVCVERDIDEAEWAQRSGDLVEHWKCQRVGEILACTCMWAIAMMADADLREAEGVASSACSTWLGGFRRSPDDRTFRCAKRGRRWRACRRGSGRIFACEGADLLLGQLGGGDGAMALCSAACWPGRNSPRSSRFIP